MIYKLYISVFVCALYLVSFNTVCAQQSQTVALSDHATRLADLRTEIEKIIKFDTEIDYKKTPGFIVGVLDNNQRYFVSFGYKNKEKTSIIAVNDVFEIGSLTKSMTSDIIHALVDEGKLNYNDQVNQYLPEIYRNPRLSEVTILDLLNHQSSLPKLPKGFGKKEKYTQNPYANFTTLDLLIYYRDYIPENFTFRYSHINYALLELIIEHTTEDSYEDALSAYLLDKLNLEDTFVDLKEQKQMVTVPGHDRSRKQVGPWIFASFKGSEGIKSSINDLLLYTQFHLNEKLKDPIHDEWNENESKRSFNAQLYQNLGWHFVMMGSNLVTINTGFTSGHTAFIGRIDHLNKAVVVLSNSSVGVGDLGLQILRMITNGNLKNN